MQIVPFSSAIAVAFETLRVNPLRTILSTLGVIIGVAALVSVLSLADGMERTARRQLDGTTDVQVMSVAPRTVERVNGEFFPLRDTLVFTQEDLNAVARIPGVAGAALTLPGRAELQLDASPRHMVAITATVPAYEMVSRRRLGAGRYFTPAESDGNAAVAVVSASLAKLVLPPETDPDSVEARAIGRDIVLGTETRRIVGVLDSDLTSPVLEAIVPLDVRRLSATNRATMLLRASTVEDVAAVDRDVRAHFATRGDSARSVEVGSYRARAAQAAQSFRILRLFMGALTGISLLVGGIGIMNVLLASVTERTREIGIRKAAGARHRDILVQFLAESVVVTVAGGLIGIVLGLTISFGVTAVIRTLAEAPFIQSSVTGTTLMVALIASVSVGLVFGTYPARRAARLSPIDAIRHE